MSTSAKRPGPAIGILNMKVGEEGGNIVASGSCIVRMKGSRKAVDTDKIGAEFPSREGAVRLTFGSRYGTKLPGGLSRNTFRIEIDREEAKDLDIQNKILIMYDGEQRGRLFYSLADLKRGKNKNSEVFVHDSIAMYFRQNVNNFVYFVVRDANQYDYPEGQARLKRAKKNAAKLKEIGRAHV